MKNREKFAKEILDIACNGGSIGIDKSTNKPIDCEDLECINCSLGGNCITGISKWSESEYVEKPKMTSREEKFLSLLESKWKYLVRGKDKTLYVFNSLPIKETDGWGQRKYIIENGTTCDCYYISKKLFGDMFDFIKWENEEPWSIEDLKKLEVEDE